ncbi:MAG: sulfite exporter TauE/SafE family protein [Clostridiales bacterium]|nr:sulfite exporter TauE/SafE family protein [Clostridiales bacterium]
MTYFFYCLAGLTSGVFGGMGMGGGTLLIPILTIFLGMDQKLAQGLNLLTFLVMAIFSIFIHYKNGYIVTKNIFWIIFFGVIFSVGGSVVMSFLPSKILKMVFGAFLCVLAIVEFIKVFKK